MVGCTSLYTVSPVAGAPCATKLLEEKSACQKPKKKPVHMSFDPSLELSGEVAQR